MKLRSPVIFAVAILFLVRLSLIGKGGLSMGDESRHNWANMAASHVRHVEWRKLCGAISDVSARPGEIILRLPVALIQSKWSGVTFLNPKSICLVQVENVLISLGVLFFFYRICCCLFPGERLLSLGATAVYALLPSSNIYLRHLVPYDTALLLFLLATDIVLRSPPSTIIKHTFWAGLATGAAFAVYPGYYAFVAMLGIVILAIPPHAFSSVCTRFGMFVAGGGLVAGALEIIARIAGKSYFRDLFELSDTIKSGSFAETFVFGPKYLWAVDKWAAALLLCFAFAAAFLAVRRWQSCKAGRPSPPSSRILLLLTALLFYLLHAFMGTVEHKMVFYGRTFHMYIPFLVVAAFVLLGACDMRGRQILSVLLGLVTLLTFFQFYAEFSRLAYPRDVLYRQRIDIANYIPPENISKVEGGERILITGNGPQVVNEMPALYLWASPPQPKVRRAEYYTNHEHLVLVNFAAMWCSKTPAKPYSPPPAAQLVLAKPYFGSYPGYLFEGFGPEERRIIQESNLQLKIYLQ